MLVLSVGASSSLLRLPVARGRGGGRHTYYTYIYSTQPICYSSVTSLKGGRVMIAFFVNYSTVAFPLHLPTLKRQQFFGAVANSLGKNSYFPLPLDVRRCVAPTGEEVDARQRGMN